MADPLTIIQQVERADSLGMAGGLGTGLGLQSECPQVGKNAWSLFLTFDLVKIVILPALLAVSMPNIFLVLLSGNFHF